MKMVLPAPIILVGWKISTRYILPRHPHSPYQNIRARDLYRDASADYTASRASWWDRRVVLIEHHRAAQDVQQEVTGRSLVKILLLLRFGLRKVKQARNNPTDLTSVVPHLVLAQRWDWTGCIAESRTPQLPALQPFRSSSKLRFESSLPGGRQQQSVLSILVLHGSHSSSTARVLCCIFETYSSTSEGSDLRFTRVPTRGAEVGNHSSVTDGRYSWAKCL